MLDLWIMAAACWTGATGGLAVQTLDPVSGPALVLPGSPPGDFLFVASNNLCVAMLVLAGACAWGIPGAFVVALNGFRMGLDSVSLLRTDPSQWLLLMRYLPFEAAGICAAAAAGNVVSWDIFTYLFRSRPFSNLGGALRLATGAVLLILGAAAAEAQVKGIRTGLAGILP